MEATGIDEKFIGYSQDAIFTKAIFYRIDENYGEYSFPFGVTDKEIKDKTFDPSVNYLYPLPDFEEHKRNIVNMRATAEQIAPITIVFFHKSDTYYLGVTGYGQDFTWNLVRAYLWLGYLPPVEYCRLPMFEGTDIRNPMEKVVVLAIKKSLELAKQTIEIKQRELERVFLSALEEFDENGRDPDTNG